MSDIPTDIILAAKICWMEMPANAVNDDNAKCVELIAKAIQAGSHRSAIGVKQAVGECLAGMMHSDVSREARRKIERSIDAATIGEA